MENTPWQVRARAVGGKQKELAAALGTAENTLSRQLRGRRGRGVPSYIKAVIVALELMSEEQRKAWLQMMASETARDGAENSQQVMQPRHHGVGDIEAASKSNYRGRIAVAHRTSAVK